MLSATRIFVTGYERGEDQGGAERRTDLGLTLRPGPLRSPQGGPPVAERDVRASAVALDDGDGVVGEGTVAVVGATVKYGQSGHASRVGLRYCEGQQVVGATTGDRCITGDAGVVCYLVGLHATPMCPRPLGGSS